MASLEKNSPPPDQIEEIFEKTPNWPEWINQFYFSGDELKAIFIFQYLHGPRLNNPIQATQLSPGNEIYIAHYRGKNIRVPGRFIKSVTQHISEMLRIGAARYIFPGDAGHAHFLVPEETYRAYMKLPDEQRWEAFLNNPRLGLLYHTAEHLKMDDPHMGPDSKEWIAKRSVIGWMDGRPLMILPPNTLLPYPSLGLVSFGGIDFSAHFLGNLHLQCTTSEGPFELRFDITLP